MSETDNRADLLIKHRCLACGHRWGKSSDADHGNCPVCSSPNWASVDTLERAQRLDRDPIEIKRCARDKREKERIKARHELSKMVKALLKMHKLTQPKETAAMTVDLLVKAIVKCRMPEPRPTKHKGEEPSPRQRLTVARTHATKLLKYATNGASHKDSVAKRSERLRQALNDSRSVKRSNVLVRTSQTVHSSPLHVGKALRSNAKDRMRISR
jgi:predicted  nucleic acid-binding Zn-ribbon protein